MHISLTNYRILTLDQHLPCKRCVDPATELPNTKLYRSISKLRFLMCYRMSAKDKFLSAAGNSWILFIVMS
ncbi:hypothetical protein GUJ93_ZPchr0014g47082 [Zizania palustris]|uniref:Uncharacterized protein n=1 Tax=Zizania palustris TaxID=103762 RepID=A0A8J5VRV6_ZIZPA|nr:hypothetical protein GUJ93_ZPchr0014g47082 [Zizania palustris]